MPYGYAITLVFVGVVVGAALIPPKRPRIVARLGYILGMVVNEVPLVAALYLLAMTALAITSDHLLSTWQGWMLLMIALLIGTACGILQARVLTARGAISAALGERIGPARGLWRSRLLPIPLRPRSVERLRNLPYAPGGREHTLDLYRLRTPPEQPARVLLFLHSGGYFSGDKNRDSRALRYRLAQRGWVVVSANYGLRPRFSYPDHLIDLKRVIAWIHRESSRYGMDPTSIVLCGSSAGAHLSVIAALSPDEPAFQPGFEEVDTRVIAAIGLYGYYGRYYGRDASEDPPSSPFGFEATGAPPVLLVHGDQDSYTPVEGARALAAYLRAGSQNPVVLAELPGAQHGFDLLASERFEAVIDGVESFLARVVAPSAPRPQ